MQTATKKETALGIRQMAMIGVMTAVTCIAAPFSIPIPVSPVPLSLTTFILYLSVYILGTSTPQQEYLQPSCYRRSGRLGHSFRCCSSCTTSKFSLSF
jgi:hypothetical protein